MTMTIDNHQRFGGLNFDHMPQHYSNSHFNHPWAASSAPSQAQNVYATSNLSHSLGLDIKPQVPRIQSNVSVTSYGNVPISAGSSELLSPSRSLSSHSGYGSEAGYSNAPSPIHSYAPTSAPYDPMGYAQAPPRSTYNVQSQEDNRRISLPSSVPSSSSGMSNGSSREFADQIDASRGMIAMSQNTTPRNIYGAQGRVGRGSGDSYGFPATHSTSSSISSTSNFGSYFTPSVASSVSDYSNTNSDIESVGSRRLPKPSTFFNGGIPPAPQSMMGQFSSKISSSTQKKHKCKVCDKRFTRPSSLQTHMYSHTGEKPFCCEIEGCGRHFSVVSNLRRHRKVHKGEARSEAGSSDHQSMDGDEED